MSADGFPFPDPTNISIVDYVFRDFREEMAKYHNWAKFEQVAQASETFYKRNIGFIVQWIQSRAHSGNNPQTIVLKNAARLAEAIFQSGEIDHQDPRSQINALVERFAADFCAALRNPQIQKIISRTIKQEYNSLHFGGHPPPSHRRFHYAIRDWDSHGGRTNVGLRGINTPRLLAKTICEFLLQAVSSFDPLMTELQKIDPKASYYLQFRANLCDQLEEKLAYHMKKLFSLNQEDSYVTKREFPTSKWLKKFQTLNLERPLTFLEKEINEYLSDLKRGAAESALRAWKRDQKKTPPELRARKFDENTRASLISGIFAVESLSHFCPQIAEKAHLSWWNETNIVSLKPDYGKNVGSLAQKLLDLPAEQKRAARGVIFRFCGLQDSDILSLDFSAFSQLTCIDLSGNFRLTQPALFEFGKKYPRIQVRAQFCLKPNPTVPPKTLVIKPFLSFGRAQLFNGTKIAYCFGSSFESCRRDAAAVSNFLHERGFETVEDEILSDGHWRDLIDQISARLAEAPDPALFFYFSGHGGTKSGANILQAQNGDSIFLCDLLSALETSFPKFMVLDCCQIEIPDAPFRNHTSCPGILKLQAAMSGELAFTGPNLSPFTETMLQTFRRPNAVPVSIFDFAASLTEFLFHDTRPCEMVFTGFPLDLAFW